MLNIQFQGSLICPLSGLFNSRPEPLSNPISIPKVSFSFRSLPRPRESSITSALHSCSFVHGGYSEDSYWVEMDKLYNGLESLEALQINLQASKPWTEAHRNAQVKKIGSLLQHLRARENFLLTFTISGEPVPWDSSDSLEDVVAGEVVIPEEGNSGDGALDRRFEPIEAQEI